MHDHQGSAIIARLTEACTAVFRANDLIRKGLQMAGQGETDLKAALTALGTAVTAATAEINSLVASAAGDPDADIEALAQQVQTQTAALNAAVASAVPPPAPGAAT